MKRSNRLKPSIAAKDDTIGSTVYLLCMYGYSLRSDVLEIVSKLAAKIIDRTDPAGRPLSVERIEQIYEEFQTRNAERAFKVVPGRYTRESRRALKPGTAPDAMEALAEILIRNAGQYSEGESIPGGPQPQLTDGAIKGLSGAPMTASMRRWHIAEMQRITQKRPRGRPKKI